MAISLKLAQVQSDERTKWVSSPPFTSGQLTRALLLALTKLLDRIVTRRHRVPE